MAKEQQQKEWYKKWWGVILAICIWPGFLIWYAWAKSSWSKNIKVGATVVGVIGVILSLSITQSTPQTTAPSNSTKTETPAQQKPTAPQPKAKYDAKILSYVAINPASLRFSARVENIGDAEGKFSCTVKGKDASSTYTGFDYFDDQDGILKPGETRAFNGVITIKREGAIYVTDVSISCK